MDENERRVQNENMDYQIIIPDYGQLIIEMVGKIENVDVLKDIYSFALGMLSVKEEQGGV